MSFSSRTVGLVTAGLLGVVIPSCSGNRDGKTSASPESGDSGSADTDHHVDTSDPDSAVDTAVVTDCDDYLMTAWLYDYYVEWARLHNTCWPSSAYVPHGEFAERNVDAEIFNCAYRDEFRAMVGGCEAWACIEDYRAHVDQLIADGDYSDSTCRENFDGYHNGCLDILFRMKLVCDPEVGDGVEPNVEPALLFGEGGPVEHLPECWSSPPM